jgi:hypothetical protein
MAAIFSLLIPLAVFAAIPEGQELIGTPAPAFNLDHWVNSSRLELSDLKGKVLLVRWWTAGHRDLLSVDPDANAPPTLRPLRCSGRRDSGLVVCWA